MSEVALECGQSDIDWLLRKFPEMRSVVERLKDMGKISLKDEHGVESNGDKNSNN
jgi:hypothetical protein